MSSSKQFLKSIEQDLLKSIAWQESLIKHCLTGISYQALPNRDLLTKYCLGSLNKHLHRMCRLGSIPLQASSTLLTTIS